MAIVTWEYKGTKTITPNGTYCLLCKDDKAYYCDEIYLSQSEGNYYLNYTIYILDISSTTWTTVSDQVQVDATYNTLYKLRYASDGEYLYFFFITYYPEEEYDYKIYCLKYNISDNSTSLLTLLQSGSQYYSFSVSKDYIYVCGGVSYANIYTFSKTGSLLNTQSTSLYTDDIESKSNINNNFLMVTDMSNALIYNYDFSINMPLSIEYYYGSIFIDGKLFRIVAYPESDVYLNRYNIDFVTGEISFEETVFTFSAFFNLIPSTHCLVFYGFNYGTQQFKIGIANSSTVQEETHYTLFNYGESGNYAYATFYDTIFIYGT